MHLAEFEEVGDSVVSLETRNSERAAGQRAKKNLLQSFSTEMLTPVPESNGLDPVAFNASNEFVEAFEVSDESELTAAINLQLGVMSSIVDQLPASTVEEPIPNDD